MRTPLLAAALLAGLPLLATTPATAAGLRPVAAIATAGEIALQPVRETGERPRREDRRNDRRGGAVEQPADELLILTRETGERPRREDRRADRRGA